MSGIDDKILESVRRTPEFNTDGSEWAIKVGGREYTKKYILDNWKKDKVMRALVTNIYMDQITHLLGRG